MFIITDLNDLVIHVGDRMPIFCEKGLEIYNGNNLVGFLLGFNETNVKIYEVSNVTKDIVSKYKFVNGELIPNRVNETWYENNFKFISTSLMNVYKGATNGVEEFVNIYLKFLLENKNEFLISIDEELIKGIKLLFEKSFTDDYETLSDVEKSAYKKAYNYRLLLIARYKIDAEVGDFYDLIADAYKQVNILTGLVLRMFLDKYNYREIPDSIFQGYVSFAKDYLDAVDAGLYKDRADIENPMEMIPRLMNRNNKIAEIVKTEYLDKKL